MSQLFVVPTRKELAESLKKRRPTGFYLSGEERSGMYQLQLRRMAQGKDKPTLSAIMQEALALLFKREKIQIREETDEQSTTGSQ